MSNQTTPPPINSSRFMGGNITGQKMAPSKMQKHGKNLLFVGAAALVFCLGGMVGTAAAPAGGERVACVAAIDNADNVLRWSSMALKNPTPMGLQAATERINEIAPEYNANKAECKGD